jgi:ubiquinone biosynthesis protein UbiJ
VIGDVAARQVANFARGLLDWGRRAGGSLATSVAEYLQEEGRDLPTRTETEEFLADVDRLRDDTERLEARLARLESRTSATVPRRPRKQTR